MAVWAERNVVDSKARILVTGAKGMVGSALVRCLKAAGYSHIDTPERHEVDWCATDQVDDWFAQFPPAYVFHIAAKVGGIAANIAEPVEFIDQNLRMQCNVLAACRRAKVSKVLFMGSSCIYPRECPQPMKEEYLLTGPLEPTNEGYALAKIAGIRLAQAYWKQYGLKVISPMVCNIYGTGDHFDLARSHVLSALVMRFVDAADAGGSQVTLWGTGNARREFIHVSDVADGLLWLMRHYHEPDIINLGVGSDVSIRELAGLVSRAAGYQGAVGWDSSRPDGMPRKCVSVERLAALGFSARISLEQGIVRTVAEYRKLKAEGETKK